FSLITNLVNLPSLLIVHPSVPAMNAQELIALARSKPGALQYSSAGSGSQPHLTAEIFKRWPASISSTCLTRGPVRSFSRSSAAKSR
ncbi:MAG: hypothetical protein JF611_13775, partial [Betaproteobacteria bacterium]|nr:hypothetical protein [Betaproteobacteria bacterium]